MLAPKPTESNSDILRNYFKPRPRVFFFAILIIGSVGFLVSFFVIGTGSLGLSVNSGSLSLKLFESLGFGGSVGLIATGIILGGISIPVVFIGIHGSFKREEKQPILISSSGNSESVEEEVESKKEKVLPQNQEKVVISPSPEKKSQENPQIIVVPTSIKEEPRKRLTPEEECKSLDAAVIKDDAQAIQKLIDEGVDVKKYPGVLINATKQNRAKIVSILKE